MSERRCSVARLHSRSGQFIQETDASGNTLNEYIFFGGKRIAILPAGGNAAYYIEDLLGSSRAMTTSNGTPCYDADFDPFGGEHPYVCQHAVRTGSSANLVQAGGPQTEAD